MAESRSFVFGSTSGSSSAAPVRSNIIRIVRLRPSKRHGNQTQSSVNPQNLTFSFATQSTEPVNNFSDKPSTASPEFTSQFPTNPVQINQGNSPFSCIASRSSVGGDFEASSSVPEAKQSLIVVSRILNGIPQSPHFYQLRNFSEVTRKFLISGWDRVFEETVEKLQFLQVVDFWVNAKELWRTMEELQSMGYNVIVLRRRLVELSEIMMKFMRAQLEINELKAEAENHRLNSSRIESIALRLQERAKKEKERADKVVIEVAKLLCLVCRGN